MDGFLLLIKYLCIEICSVYTFIRILNLNGSRTRTDLLLRSAAAALIPALFAALMNQPYPELTPLLLTGASISSLFFLFREDLQRTIIAATLSHGFSYCTRLLAILPFSYLISRLHLDINDYVLQALIFVLQFLFHLLLLHFRRLRHGFPFLDDPQYYETGTTACLVVLFAIAVANTNSNNYIFLGIMLLLLLFLLTTVNWVQRTMRRKYRDQLQKAENDRIQKELDRLSSDLKKMKEENERLSSLIHRDNKLLPALLLSVREFLYRTYDETDPGKRQEEAEKILAYLESVAAERSQAVKNYEFAGQPLPDTGSPRINAMLSYMNQRAFSSRIQFQMTCAADFLKTIRNSITEEELSTLLADLTENALIAVRDCESRHVLLSLDLRGGRAAVAVYDSGIPFPPEVRAVWGVRRLTTHADTGGSGIGMMTTWELCQKSGAEFQIEEYPPGMPYTKCISVTFPEQPGQAGEQES